MFVVDFVVNAAATVVVVVENDEDEDADASDDDDVHMSNLQIYGLCVHALLAGPVSRLYILRGKTSDTKHYIAILQPDSLTSFIVMSTRYVYHVLSLPETSCVDLLACLLAPQWGRGE